MEKKLVLPAILNNLEAFQDHVRSAARECGFADTNRQQIELALEEILVNIIKYAYSGNVAGDIEVSCSRKVDCTGLQIRVTDSGSAFDPLAREDPDTTLDLAERSIGGLGILLAREMMDDVRYERKDEKNILTMTKNR